MSMMPSKNSRTYSKNVQKKKYGIAWLNIMKMKMKIRNRSHGYDINRPRPRHGHKYVKYKKLSQYDGDHVY